MKNEIQEVCKKFGKLIGNDIRDSWDLLKDSNIISTLTDDIVYRVNNESNYYLLIDWITDSDVKRFISDLEAIIGIRGIKNDKVMVLINRNLSLPQTKIKFVSTDYLMYKVGLHFNRQDKIKRFYKDLSFLTDKRERKILSLNRRLNNCWHRVLLLALSSKHNLFENNYITYNLDPEFDSEIPPLDELINLTAQPKGSYNLISQKELYTEMDTLVKNKKNVYESFSHESPGYIFTIKDETVDIYKSSYISLVTETFFYEDDYIITEKVYKPIIHYHPFIVLGSPYTLKHMRSIGFKTFGDFWDESYDEEENNDKRFETVFNLLMKFDKMPIEELHKLYIDMIPTLKYNYDLIVGRGSMKQLTENLGKSISVENENRITK
jgi:hypothetical protein|tara:strand:- start:18 stop:1154 length:1137 start_codon:yes stop_codon:yes gene_type:complete